MYVLLVRHRDLKIELGIYSIFISLFAQILRRKAHGKFGTNRNTLDEIIGVVCQLTEFTLRSF